MAELVCTGVSRVKNKDRNDVFLQIFSDAIVTQLFDAGNQRIHKRPGKVLSFAGGWYYLMRNNEEVSLVPSCHCQKKHLHNWICVSRN